MDATVAALLGALIGGLLSAASSLLAQRVQSRSQWLSQEMQRRQQLYSEFIDAATSAYADALEHDKPDAPMLSRVYAEIGRMRLHSSNEVIGEAYALVHQILAAYRDANRTAVEIRELLAQDAVDIYIRPSGMRAGPSWSNSSRTRLSRDAWTTNPFRSRPRRAKRRPCLQRPPGRPRACRACSSVSH